MTEFSEASRLANLIIAGVNKAGSTSLFQYLSSHPDICGSRDKETCYFLPILYNKPVPPIGDYQQQFAHCDAGVKYRMEATPAYFYGGQKLASHISVTLSDVKVIIILKDPVERLLSFYHRKKTTFQLHTDITLEDYVKKCLEIPDSRILSEENKLYTGVYFGQYHEHMQSWFDVFGDRLKIVFFDDLKKDTGTFMTDLCKWIDVDPSFYENYSFDVMNKSHNYKNGILHRLAVMANNAGKGVWRSNPAIKKSIMRLYYSLNGTPLEKPKPDDATISFLKNYYIPHNDKLHTLLHSNGVMNLPPWLNGPVKAMA